MSDESGPQDRYMEALLDGKAKLGQPENYERVKRTLKSLLTAGNPKQQKQARNAMERLGLITESNGQTNGIKKVNPNGPMPAPHERKVR